ncbi:hypothetical protein [Zoogloea sp.]|uniref:hypothetical protein n=1 Tax=Zoogloea sp. TaxID=49181 RepID=UPI0014163A26|nr:MAG: hypothetical protein F9K15_01815 [Zoogloea sp.]
MVPVWRILAGLCACLSVRLAGAETLRVGPGEAITTIADASRQARDGDVVEIVAASYRGDVAVWDQRKLTIRGVSGRPRVVADGQSAEGKGIWVMRGGDIEVVNLAFEGARGRNLDGSGIRLEAGHLRVRDCLFVDNEMGIMTENQSGISLEVEDSEFAHGVLLPRPRISHLLYAGRIDRLDVTGSYFHHGRIGHLLKSRAAVSRVSYSRFSDEAGGQASYEMDFPEGGEVALLGNIVWQGAATENRRLIAFGAEGLRGERHELVMVANTLVDDVPGGGEFVAIWTPERVRVVAVDNLLLGGCVGTLCPDAVFPREQEAAPGWTRLSGQGNLQLHDAVQVAAWIDRGLRPVAGEPAPLRPPEGESRLQPDREFVLPVGTRPTGRRDVPGALGL